MIILRFKKKAFGDVARDTEMVLRLGGHFANPEGDEVALHTLPRELCISKQQSYLIATVELYVEEVKLRRRSLTT